MPITTVRKVSRFIVFLILFICGAQSLWAQALTPGAINYNQSICSGEIPARPLVEVTAAAGGCTTKTYQWQQSIDSIAWSDIAGAPGTGYTETAAIS